MTARTRARLILATVALLPALGCSQLPTDGPIVETRSSTDVDEAQPLGFDPVPPQPNASKVDIVNGFLDAMTAWPQRLDVAKKFLSQETQGSWKPEASTITYLDVGPVIEGNVTVSVELVDPEHYDERGAWKGPLALGEQVLDLQIVEEDEEYRILDPPDAQIVPSDWFADRYRQANVYFFDNTNRILVPEPVFVPRGDQAATTLVSRLLEGPAEPRVESTAFPPGTDLDFSTPVFDDGIAEIRLVGNPPPASQEAIEKMVAQLAWTLRQEEITALRLTISGVEMSLPGGVSEIDVDSAPAFNPTGSEANYALYGLRNGLLVAGNRDELTPVAGPFGVTDRWLRSVAVSIDGATAVGVSKDGHRLLAAPVREPSNDEPPGGESTLVAGASNLLRPAWDFAERLWVVDRTSAGAKVSYIEGARAHAVDVPGVSERNVTSFLVSRDATRFVAVVRASEPEGAGTIDELRVGRIEALEEGGELRIRSTKRIPLEDAGSLRIKDITWTSTTTIAVLREVTEDELYSVQTVAVDGAPTDTSPTTISGPVTGLAGTPVPESRQYVVTPTSLIDIHTGAETFLDDSGYSSLGYVG
ncbi:MAG: LpqB family beta-propeller domain-containing protein [Actinomycetota bacterium]|nr:LpqB family beta-propeller domain-containing protein [Actinomycetota bacterium]